MDTTTLKHLELLQAIINRMASQSSLLKGWTVTLVSGLLAFAAKESNSRYAVVALFPSMTLWMLDAYHLRQERLFRSLYDRVRTDETWAPLSMDTSCFENQITIGAAFFSRQLFLFYGPLLGVTSAVLLVAICSR